MADLAGAPQPRVPPGERESVAEATLASILASHEATRDELIPILQQLQQVFGYLPEWAMKRVAKFLKLRESTVFGVATFYAQFKLVPSGRSVIKVCRGTACHVRGAPRILQEVEKQLGIGPGESTPDLEYSLETVACFGSCALAPVMVIGNKVHGNLTPTKVKEILAKGAG